MSKLFYFKEISLAYVRCLVLFDTKVLSLRIEVDLDDGIEEELCILQSSSTAETSPSDCLVSYLGHSLVVVGSYPSAKKQSVISTAPANTAIKSDEEIQPSSRPTDQVMRN